MPIIEALADPKTPLCQGDILKGVSLFSTGKAWQGGGEAYRSAASMCLVMSRPCVALRDEWVVVTAIEKYKNRPPAFESLKHAKNFYATARDGLTTPDLFYLGQIDGHDGSFCARFDSYHTIQIPKDETPEREAFLANFRIGRLNKDFAHDLHLRKFRAFASLGFDDHRWYATEDLRVIVIAADKDLNAKQQELLVVQQQLQIGRSQGFQHESTKKKLEEKEAELKEEFRKLTEEIQPYKDELSARGNSGSLSSGSQVLRS